MVILDHAVKGHIGQRSACQCRLGRADLSPAAVHQQQVRLLPEIIIAALPLCGQRGVFLILCRPPGHRLGQRSVVVCPQHGLHPELPISGFVGLAIPEGDHAADAGAIAPVGDIVALNGARRLCQPQHLRHLIQQLFLTGVAAALPGQPFHRVGVGHLHQMGLIAPLGHIELHLTAPLFVQGLLQRFAVRRQLVHGNDLWDLLIVQIVPGQKLLPHSGNVRCIVEKELPLIGQPPLPEAQDRRTDTAGGTGQRHHIHLHLRVHHDLLARCHLGDGVDLVPEEGRCLEFQPVRGFQHPLVQSLENVFFAVPDQMHRVLYGLIVVLAADLAAAHGHALADMGIQAGPPLADILGEPLAAPGQQKGIQRGLGHLPGRKGRGIGADVFSIVLLLLQYEGKAGPGFPGHLDIAVAFVILQQDIVLGGVRLDLAGFQHQRLELALADDDIKRIGVGDHLADLVVVGHPLAEILAHPDAQALGFADIDDGIAFVPDDIHTGQKRQHTGFLIQFCFGHGSSLVKQKAAGNIPPPQKSKARITLQSQTRPA